MRFIGPFVLGFFLAGAVIHNSMWYMAGAVLWVSLLLWSVVYVLNNATTIRRRRG